MPLGFLQFDEEPEGISKQLDEDLKIINEDEPPAPEVINPNESPFITEPKRKPAFKPPPIASQKEVEENVEVDISEAIVEKPNKAKQPKAIKSKKPLSEKQKAHLEKMRLKRVEKKKAQLEKRMEKSDIVAKAEKKMDKPINEVTEMTEEEIMEMDKKEFDKWLKYMDKFERMMNAIQKEEERKLEKLKKQEEARIKKEMELEKKIREKIEREMKEKENKKYNKPDYSNIVNTQPILEQTTNDYGEFSNMFGY
jgi:hypothetical protein